MASPLTRIKVRTTKDLYTRRPVVEAEIDHVLALTPAERKRRGRTQDPASGEFLRSETLVYLIRQDVRAGGDGMPYLQTLTQRCRGNLTVTIHPDVPEAAQLRQDILQDFAVSFAREAIDPGDALDFFEVMFNAAFKALRIEKFNQHMRRHSHAAPQAFEADAARDVAAPRGTSPDIWKSQRGEEAAYLRQVVALVMTFPIAERQAIALCRIKGMTQVEAGRVLGVDERTIRNLLRRADAKLARIKESA